MLKFWKPFESQAVEKRIFKPVPGGYVHYPFGVFGKGYLINEEQKGAFKRIQKRGYILGGIVAIATIAAAKLAGWVAVAVGAFVFVAAQLLLFWETKRRLAGIRTTEERLSTRGVWLESQAEVARTWSSKRLFWHFMVGALLILLSIDAFRRLEAEGDLMSYWAPAFLAIGGTFMLAHTALLFVLRRQERERA